jgi:hypothetical protein
MRYEALIEAEISRSRRSSVDDKDDERDTEEDESEKFFLPATLGDKRSCRLELRSVQTSSISVDNDVMKMTK